MVEFFKYSTYSKSIYIKTRQGVDYRILVDYFIRLNDSFHSTAILLFHL